MYICTLIYQGLFACKFPALSARDQDCFSIFLKPCPCPIRKLRGMRGYHFESDLFPLDLEKNLETQDELIVAYARALWRQAFMKSRSRKPWEL